MELEQLDEYRAPILSALRQLERSLAVLGQMLSHTDVRARVAPGAEGVEPRQSAARRAVADAYLGLRLQPGDLKNTSIKLAGVVGAPGEVVAQARRVNADKLALRAATAPLSNQTVRVPADGVPGGTVITALRAVLRRAQASDVNLLAAYRLIPILRKEPRRVAYTRSRSRSIYVLSRSELLEKLKAREGDDAKADRARVLNRTAIDEEFAWVKNFHPILRANVWYARPEVRRATFEQVRAELPLLYARSGDRRTSDDDTAVEVVWPPPNWAEEAPTRERVKYLEEAPFLASMPVYRYLARKRRATQRG